MTGRLSILKVVSLLWILLAVSHFTLTAAEQDFNYRYKNQTVKYRVLDHSTKTCITCPGEINANQTISAANNISGNLVIPEIVSDGYDEYTVVGVGEGSFSSNYITHLELPNTIEQIGNHAFARCTKLQTVALSDSLRLIGEYAFSGCNALQYLNLPFSLNGIDTGAFMSCSELTQIIIPNNVKCIRSYTFRDCRKLEQVIISNSVVSIEMEAFANCTLLKSVFMPKSVSYVGDRAFMNCQNFTSLYYEQWPATVKSDAFSQCKKLRKIEINSGFELEPSSLVLNVGESGNIFINSNNGSGSLYFSTYSFTMFAQFSEESIIRCSWDSYNSGLIVTGVSPGYSLVQFECYDNDENLKSLGYCYVTVTDTPDENKIEDIVCNPDTTSDVKYYDLNGRPINIDMFTGGIVIRQHASKADKIYIR